MIITKTPFRISFFGGGTDIPQYFENGMGSIISTTFNKYVYTIIRHLPKFFDYSTELIYSKIERINSIDEMQHPMVRNAMKYMNIKDMHILYDADLPARSGLGTSSSFAVGLLNAFNLIKGVKASKKQLADDAIYLERVLCNESGGWQDQIAASFGGFNRIDFNKEGYHVRKINISKPREEMLDNNLLLFFTGFTRFSSDIQKDTLSTIEDKKKQLDQMLLLVDEAQNILENETNDLDDFGRLLHKEWMLKKSTGKAISNEYIDNLYNKALEAGALGGKLLGAGGGGFLLFYVTDENKNRVRKAFSNLMEVQFRFEKEGTHVLHSSLDNSF